MEGETLRFCLWGFKLSQVQFNCVICTCFDPQLDSMIQITHEIAHSRSQRVTPTAAPPLRTRQAPDSFPSKTF